jgi:hypothetical protein
MRIAMISAQRNEGPYLLEWIAHHQRIGVADFLIYSNDCDDRSDALLDALDQHNIVTHVKHDQSQGKSVQWQALKSASRHSVYCAADWALFADTDEFVCLKSPVATLPQLIDRCGDVDAIALSWRLFGNSGQVEFSDKPTIERFTKAAPETLTYPALASQIKTLFRPTAFRECGVHRPKNKADGKMARWSDGSGRPLDPRFGAAQSKIMLYGLRGQMNLAQLNHYSVRSIEEFLVKTGRGLPNRSDKKVDASYWIERNFNVEDDSTLASNSDKTAVGIAALKALPGVADLHDESVAWHRAEINRILETPEGWRLYGRLQLAGDSLVLADATAKRIIAKYTNVKKT